MAAQIPPAREIVLKLQKPLAPPFHRHIAKTKLRGKTCRAGDAVVVYEVVSTEPAGPVLVSESTLIRFE